MAWGIDRKALEAGRDDLAAKLAGRERWPWRESLGRARRWLDEPAREDFLAAAEGMKARGGLEGGVGNMLRLAGEDGREWFERALAADPQREGQFRYLLGETPPPGEEPLARAVAALARGEAAQAREDIVIAIRAERTPPHQESGLNGPSLFDWLEESFRVEGDPLTDHLALLDRAGLLKAKAAPRKKKAIDHTPPAGTHVALDGAVLDADAEGDVTIAVEPGVRVLVFRQWGDLGVQVQDEKLPDLYKGFREACDAAADRLRAHDPAAADAVSAIARVATGG